jgi:hypothetical protein
VVDGEVVTAIRGLADSNRTPRPSEGAPLNGGRRAEVRALYEGSAGAQLDVLTPERRQLAVAANSVCGQGPKGTRNAITPGCRDDPQGLAGLPAGCARGSPVSQHQPL